MHIGRALQVAATQPLPVAALRPRLWKGSTCGVAGVCRVPGRTYKAGSRLYSSEHSPVQRVVMDTRLRPPHGYTYIRPR